MERREARRQRPPGDPPAGRQEGLASGLAGGLRKNGASGTIAKPPAAPGRVWGSSSWDGQETHVVIRGQSNTRPLGRTDWAGQHWTGETLCPMSGQSIARETVFSESVTKWSQ
ncbi:uncharacterized protein ACIGJ3_017044 [Trichechus inunguis]